MANQTPNLLIDHWIAAQGQPEVTVDAALDAFDRSLCGTLVHDMSSDADYTLSNVSDPKEWRYLVINITDTSVNLTTARNIIVPINTKLYLFANDTAQSLTLKTSGGSGVAVAAGDKAVLYCDGTNVVEYAYVVTAVEPFDVGCTVAGTPGNAQECLRIPMVRDVSFPASMTGSQSKAGTASTGNVAFSVKKNGTEFATITFNTTATGVFAAASATSLTAGDQLTIVAPATADSTLADIGIMLKGTRT